MSQQMTVDIELKDKACIVGALKEMGYKVEEYDTPVLIETYDRSKVKAGIVVRKQQGFHWGDVGFEQTKTGFKVHIDDSDRRRLDMGKLKQLYSDLYIKKSVNSTSKNRISYREVMKDGKIKIKIKTIF